MSRVVSLNELYVFLHLDTRIVLQHDVPYLTCPA